MARSTKDTVLTLRPNMGAVGADALAEYVVALYTALAAITAKLDADVGVTDTDYTALLNEHLEE